METIDLEMQKLLIDIYEAFGSDIMHDTDRSFVVWNDEGEYKYVELQNIEPPRTEMKEYESIIKFYYSDIKE